MNESNEMIKDKIIIRTSPLHGLTYFNGSIGNTGSWTSDKSKATKMTENQAKNMLDIMGPPIYSFLKNFIGTI
jgi:hypothetical protein